MFTRKVSSLGVVLLSLLLLLPSSDTHAGDRRRVRAVSPPSSPLTITFLGAEGGVLEAGSIVWRGGAKRSTVTARTVRLRIGEPSAESRGSVTVARTSRPAIRAARFAWTA